MALKLTQKNFQQEVLDSDLPVLVDFWAPWCGPCQALGPIVEEVAAEADGFRVGKVNVDEEPDLARQYQVMSIPTLIVFKNGQAVRMEVGGRDKDGLLALLK